MKTVVQRVASASVSIDGRVFSAIKSGLVVLLGIADSDREPDAGYLSKKIVHLRVFEDEVGKMNRSLLETAGEMLVVSQFTLLADCKKGRRPSFTSAARPALAEALYEHFVSCVHNYNLKVKTGQFGARMNVSLINDGPVTLILDSNHQ